MGVIKSKMGRKFEQKRKKSKMVKRKQIWSRPSDSVYILLTVMAQPKMVTHAGGIHCAFLILLDA